MQDISNQRTVDSASDETTLPLKQENVAAWRSNPSCPSEQLLVMNGEDIGCIWPGSRMGCKEKGWHARAVGFFSSETEAKNATYEAAMRMVRIRALLQNISERPDVQSRTECSPGPFTQEVTMSSDFEHIRRINDAEGRAIADVRYADGADQSENLLNASVLAASWRMLEVLESIVKVLSDHPDVDRGNSKVHFASQKAKGAIALATKINAHDHEY